MSIKKTFIPHWAYYTAVSKRDKHDVEVPDNFFTGGNILVKKVTLKKEQIILLADNGVEVLEAPGLGKMNDVLRATVRVRAGNTPFDSDSLSLWYPSLIGTANPIVSVDGLINSAVDKILHLIVVGPDAAENDAVIVKLDGPAPTEGDGEIDIYIVYRIITL